MQGYVVTPGSLYISICIEIFIYTWLACVHMYINKRYCWPAHRKSANKSNWRLTKKSWLQLKSSRSHDCQIITRLCIGRRGATPVPDGSASLQTDSVADKYQRRPPYPLSPHHPPYHPSLTCLSLCAPVMTQGPGAA